MGLDPNPLGVYERLIVGTNPERLALDTREACRPRGNIYTVIEARRMLEQMPSQASPRLTESSPRGQLPRGCRARCHDMRAARFNEMSRAGSGSELASSAAQALRAMAKASVELVMQAPELASGGSAAGGSAAGGSAASGSDARDLRAMDLGPMVLSPMYLSPMIPARSFSAREGACEHALATAQCRPPS